MATYDSLTADQKALLDEQVTQLRAYAGAANRLMKTAQNLADMFNVGGSAIITILDVGATVPNRSGFAGTQALTKEDLESLVTDIDTALNFFSSQTKRELQIKAAGSGVL